MNDLRRRLAATLALLTLTTLGACASGPTPQSGLPVPKVSASAAEAAEALPAGFMMVGLQPREFGEALPALMAYAPTPMAAPGQAPDLESLSRDLYGEVLPVDGLDLDRRIYLGVWEPTDAESFQNTVYGAAPRFEGIPIPLRATALLPATDVSALETSVRRWLAVLRLEPALISAEQQEQLGERSIFSSPDGFTVVLTQRPKGLRADIFVIGAGGLEHVFAQLDAPPRGDRRRTPALNRFLAQADAVSVYLDRSRLPAIAAASGLAQGFNALSYATPEDRPQLFAQMWAILLNSAAIMAPSRRLVHDSTLAIEVDEGGMTVDSVSTLTELGARTYAAGREEAGPTWSPAADSPTSVQLNLNLSLRAMVEEAGQLSWTTNPAEAFWIIDMGGFFNILYTSSGSLAHSVASLADQSGLIRLPDSASLVVGANDPDTGEPSGLALVATTRDDGKLISDEIMMNAAPMLDAMGGGLSRKPVGERTRHDLTLRQPLDAMMDMKAPAAAESDVTLSVDLQDTANLTRQADPALAELLGGIHHLEFKSVSRDHTLSATLRLSKPPADDAAPQAPVKVQLIGGEAPEDAPTAEGWRCLEDATLAQSSFFAGLSGAAPQVRDKALAAGQARMEELLACARKTPESAPMADDVEANWLFIAASVAHMNNELEQALVWSERSCALDHKGACALAAEIRPPWPGDALTLASAPWFKLPEDDKLGTDLTVGLTTDAIFVGPDKVGDASAAGSPKVARAVKAGLDAIDADHARLRVVADRGAPWRDLAAFVQMAREFDVNLALVVQDTGDGREVRGSFRPARQGGSPAARRAAPTPVWVDVTADAVRLRIQKPDGTLAASTLPDDEDQLLGLQRALTADLGASPYVVYRVHAAPEVPWHRLVGLLAFLDAPLDLNLEGAGSLQDAMAMYGPHRLSAPPSVVLLSSPEAPEAKK